MVPLCTSPPLRSMCLTHLPAAHPRPQRAPDKRAPGSVAKLFSLLALAPLPLVVLYVWTQTGVNLKVGARASVWVCMCVCVGLCAAGAGTQVWAKPGAKF